MNHKIRIIGGQWRGRKLAVLDIPDLRPTPDRVRETLFNWLQNVIVGANCLDPFAGSGALGFEALSRGALSVTFVDQSHEVIRQLRQQAEVFEADNIEIYQGVAPKDLKKPDSKFDIVFLDPPFKENFLLPCCQFLEEKNFLSNKCYLYLETSNPLTLKDLPANWEILKSKKAGQVSYHLILRTI